MGLSMSPVLKSPSTSLASEPQMPERMGLVMTQSGLASRASSMSCRPKGLAISFASRSSSGVGRTSSAGRRRPEQECLHDVVSPWLCCVNDRIPSRNESMSVVLASITAFMSGR